MEAMDKTVAVLMTCHNRREKTLECLRTLFAQQMPVRPRIRVYLVDDGSSDGTGDAVRERYPETRVIQGDGSLYWNGGMRLAMSAAISDAPDFYLWLNDDTRLAADALARLLRTYESRADERAIIVGSLCDPGTQKVTYGGSRTISRINPLKVEMLVPTDEPQRCDVFNGNVVLVPRRAVEMLGNLSDRFKHRSGDYEFALRAKRAGIPAWVAPGYCGECARNPTSGTWRDKQLPAGVRVKKLLSPTGAPIAERFYLLSRFGGPLWPWYFISVYAKFIAGIILRR